MKVSVSFLFGKNPKKLVMDANNSNCDYLHVDIMDGKFVENKSVVFSEVKKLVSNSNKKLDVHLMVKNPMNYIDDYALLNTEYITVHLEIGKCLNDSINKIKEYGLRVGISINPETNVNDLIPYLDQIDLILLMSVKPGKSGQSFNEGVLYKLEVLRKIIDEKGLNILITVDGGIDNEKAHIVKEKGADMVVSTSYLESDFERNLRILKEM